MSSTIVIAAPWQALLRAHRLDSVDAVYALSVGTMIKRANSTEVLCIRLAEGDREHQLYIKKYRVTKFNQLLSGFFRGTFLGRSKVQREFENLAQLRRWGLDAPVPIAYGEQRCAGWLIRSLLVSEGVPEPVPLDVFIRDLLPQQPQQRHELVEHLANYVCRLHDHHFVHHDLYWRNIILSDRSLDHFSLIDAHKGSIWKDKRERKARAQDLATLDAPAPAFFRRTERLRFFLRYRGREKLTSDDRTLLRLTLQIALPLRSRQLKRVQMA